MWRLLVPVLFLTACTTSNSTFRLKESNDWFSTGGKSDRNFTQGLELIWDTKDDENTLTKVSSYLPSFSPNSPEADTSTLTLGQKIYTPDDLKATELQVDDNPYAGWLYGEITRHSQVEEVQMDTSLSLGVVGPASYGREVQTWFHKLCNCQNPNGWDNQLDNEPAVMLIHNRRWIDDEDNLFWLLYWEQSSEVEFRAGNVHTDFTYAKNFKVGTSLDPHEKGFNCYAFTRMGATTIARNIFYDGNTVSDSHSVDTNPLVGFFVPGIHLQYNSFGVDIAFVNRTNDYEEQKGNFQSFGMITIGIVPERLFGN